jgi:hypothetical protein
LIFGKLSNAVFIIGEIINIFSREIKEVTSGANVVQINIKTKANRN